MLLTCKSPLGTRRQKQNYLHMICGLKTPNWRGVVRFSEGSEPTGKWPPERRAVWRLLGDFSQPFRPTASIPNGLTTLAKGQHGRKPSSFFHRPKQPPSLATKRDFSVFRALWHVLGGFPDLQFRMLSIVLV